MAIIQVGFGLKMLWNGYLHPGFSCVLKDLHGMSFGVLHVHDVAIGKMLQFAVTKKDLQVFEFALSRHPVFTGRTLQALKFDTAIKSEPAVFVKKAADLLINHGVDINNPNLSVGPILHWVMETCNADLVRFFLDPKARATFDPEDINDCNQSAADAIKELVQNASNTTTAP